MIGLWTSAKIIGRCTACKQIVPAGEHHRCSPLAMIDTSWEGINNPDNIPWLPGYRFYVIQESQGRGAYQKGIHKVRRRYRVMFKIDKDGLLQHTHGPKPTEATWAGVRALHAKERPGSNGAPPLDD